MFRGTFAVVNQQAIRENVMSIRSRLKPGTKLLVAVKANGYGHGMEQAAHAAIAGGADALGVASLEEALRLRQANIHTPILVLGRVPVSGLAVAAQNEVSVTITSDWRTETIAPLPKSLKVHLKLDTGMSRLGFVDPDVASDVALWVQGRSDMELVGVFSHLACADADDTAHMERQVARFDQMLQVLEERGVRPPVAHLANSAGTLRGEHLHYEMVRVGIAVYGYPPSPSFETPVHLQPALSLYARIQRVTMINIGDTVGYGATFLAQRPTRVATIHVGYADGYFRTLSNRSHVWVRGAHAPVIGNVCMDQMMIDVTELPEVSVGDWVSVYGQAVPAVWNDVDFLSLPEEQAVQFVESTFVQVASQPPVVTLDTLATLTGTISYELMCALSPRVPKIYFGESLNNG